MTILPDLRTKPVPVDLSHLVVSPHFGPDGDRIQLRDAKRNHQLAGTFDIESAAGISRVLHRGEAAAVELATRFDRAIAEAIYAAVARTHGDGAR